MACVAGVAISYFGWRCRQICSATGFTILGVANKLLSVLGNALLRADAKPISPPGAACLVGCLLLAAQYRPARPRQGRTKAQ